ncbi:MAG: ATP-grasp domain-containing protein [Deltaproteobacteria bacterium]
MLLRDLGDVRDLLARHRGTVLGVGMTAYSRMVPGYFLNTYCQVALRNTRDLTLLQERNPVFCLEQQVGEPLLEKGLNSARLLEHPLVKSFLRTLPDPKYLFLYQNYAELEALSEKEGWIPMANSACLRTRMADRGFFEEMCTRLGLRKVPGGIYALKTIHDRPYDFWSKMLGPALVVQLPEIIQGGGRGTFYIRSGEEYEAIKGRLKGNAWRGISLNRVSLHRFLEGVPVSLALCITRHGVLISRLQRQLIDLPYCRGLSEKGIFCGHEWTRSAWPEKVEEDAIFQARQIAEYLGRLSFRGVFGIDFLIDDRRSQVFPIEINPRFTGAFPMLSLLHMKDGLIPFEAFHLLEFLDLPYEIDLEGMNEAYESPLEGSHLLLFLSRRGNTVRRGLEAGLYEKSCETGRIFFVKKALDYGAILNQRQFLLVDGPPAAVGGVLPSDDPLYRVGRLLFPHGALDETGSLSPEVLSTVEWAYEMILGG